jgi:hypothetical protein
MVRKDTRLPECESGAPVGALVNTVMYFCANRYLLTGSATVNFSRREQLFHRHDLANNTREAKSTMGKRSLIYEGVQLARWGRCF